LSICVCFTHTQPNTHTHTHTLSLTRKCTNTRTRTRSTLQACQTAQSLSKGGLKPRLLAHIQKDDDSGSSIGGGGGVYEVGEDGVMEYVCKVGCEDRIQTFVRNVGTVYVSMCGYVSAYVYSVHMHTCANLYIWCMYTHIQAHTYPIHAHTCSHTHVIGKESLHVQVRLMSRTSNSNEDPFVLKAGATEICSFSEGDTRTHLGFCF